MLTKIKVLDKCKNQNGIPILLVSVWFVVPGKNDEQNSSNKKQSSGHGHRFLNKI